MGRGGGVHRGAYLSGDRRSSHGHEVRPRGQL